MLAALGLVSYGVYLWHEVWLDKWFTWTGRAPFSGHFWALLAVDGTLTLLVAVASWFVVERPALRRKMRPRRSEAVALA
jgi:peptidoglycan/LPS O-acetylase OafA/YrhL